MFQPIKDIIGRIDGLEKTNAKTTKPKDEQGMEWESVKAKVDELPDDYEKLVRDVFMSHPNRIWRNRSANGTTIYVRGNGIAGNEVYLIWRERWGKNPKTEAQYTCFNNNLRTTYTRTIKDWQDVAEDILNQ